MILSVSRKYFTDWPFAPLYGVSKRAALGLVAEAAGWQKLAIGRTIAQWDGSRGLTSKLECFSDPITRVTRPETLARAVDLMADRSARNVANVTANRQSARLSLSALLRLPLHEPQVAE